MARTWDTVSTYNTNTAFTTARSYSHTVGGGTDRYIFQGISTEDFSTGGGAQTPSSVAYGGNALTLDSIVTDASVQTAAIYSGQDSVCGTAGAHNMVITYAGEVDAIVCFTASCDNVKQQVKEATGTTSNGSGTSKTSTVVTVTSQSLIIAMTGNDVGTGNTASWNVSDAEIGDVANASVMGSMNRYEKAIAGSQSVTATFSGSATRTGIVSAAYETINDLPPTVANITAQTGYFGTPKSVACTLTKTMNDIVQCSVTTDGTSVITLTASGAAVVYNNGTTGPYVLGTNADVIATLGNGISLSGVRSFPEFSHVETITVIAVDSLGVNGSDTFTMTWSVVTGVGTTTLKLTGTQAQINAALATVEVTSSGAFFGSKNCFMYSVTSTPLNDADTFFVTVSPPNEMSIPLLVQNIYSKSRGVI